MLRALDYVLNFKQNLGSEVVCFLFVEPELGVLREVLVLDLFNLNLSAQDVPVAYSVYQVDHKWLPVVLDIELKRFLVYRGFTTLHVSLHHFICLVHHHETLLNIVT
jgi:hypothetical protein